MSLECAFGHRVDPDDLVKSTELQVSEALWMAIQALDNEADVLRAIGGEEGRPYADDAARQAKLLREFGRANASGVNDFRHSDES
jgi:hypothetical protein